MFTCIVLDFFYLHTNIFFVFSLFFKIYLGITLRQLTHIVKGKISKRLLFLNKEREKMN